MVNPSPQAGEMAEANRCTTCHDPHGNKDAGGVIPSLLQQREPDLCLQCHDGSRAPDIRGELTKTYRHPVDGRGNRRAACDDCHNVHEVRSDPAPPSAPEASNRLAGVSRVEVMNGGAGALPTYRSIPANDPGSVLEFQLCFKCHSSYAKQPSGQDDLARLLNPNNPSFHPVEADGKNPNIDPASFANGWSARGRLLCTSCHTTDDRRLRGPHGSSYPYLLKKAYPTPDDPLPAQQDQLCFDCHSFSVYADARAPESVARASRFNGPAAAGHVFHVAVQRVPCSGCHEAHGSIRFAALMTSRRGMTSYVQTVAGGTCTTTCHALKTYTSNYPR